MLCCLVSRAINGKYRATTEGNILVYHFEEEFPEFIARGGAEGDNLWKFFREVINCILPDLRSMIFALLYKMKTHAKKWQLIYFSLPKEIRKSRYFRPTSDERHTMDK